jgi:hypothetical protein
VSSLGGSKSSASSARPESGTWVEDLAVEGLDDLDDEADDRRRGEVLAALLALGNRELAEEVLVDLAEGVTLNRAEHRVHGPEQPDESVVRELLIGAR